MNKDSYHDYGAAPIKGEGQTVSYDTVQRTPEEMVKYLSEQLHIARMNEAKYRRVKRMAKRGQVMIANKDGFTLVEDLDEYLATMSSQPLTTKELLADAYDQLEAAFDRAEAGQRAAP